MADEQNPPDLEITDSTPDGLRVTTDHPYSVLFVSDFGGTEAGEVSGALSEGVVRIKPDNFDEVMASACPTVRFKTTDPLAAGNVMVEVGLRFDSLKSFDPQSLAAQLPVTKRMLDVRARVVERLRGKCEFAEVERLAATAAAQDDGLSWLPDSLKWTPGAAPSDPSAVDGLLGQIDLDGAGDTEPPDSAPPKSPIGSMVAAAAGGTAIPAEEASALRRTLGELDRRVSAWLTAVQHAPEVLSIEKAWRSLVFLVGRFDFRKGIRLSALHAAGGELLERFRSKLIDPVFDEGADQPHLILVDSHFGNAAPDLEALDELAQHAASLPAVVLAGVSSQFFGVKHTFQMATLPTISGVLEQWQFAKWKSLRASPHARSLGVVFGRCLLREPFGRDKKDDLEFSYREECVTDKGLTWGSGVLAGGCSIARSVAATGWPTAMSGIAHGRVEGFKTCLGGKKGDKKYGPSDAQLPQSKIEELGMAGVNAAASLQDIEDVFFCNGMTAARPDRNEPAALFEVSMPYQLFATRLSAMLFSLKPSLSGKSAEQLASSVTTHVRDWLGVKESDTEEQVAVQVRDAEGAPGALEMAVTVTPPQEVLPGGVPVVMGYRVN